MKLKLGSGGYAIWSGHGSGLFRSSWGPRGATFTISTPKY